MSLTQILAALRAKYAGLRPEISRTMERHIEELRTNGALDNVLQRRDRAPEFTLESANGTMVSSAELLRQGPLVVSFYRGKWCPYCNAEVDALAQAYPEIKALGGELVVLSPELAEYSKAMSDEFRVPFDILVDRHNAVAEEFGVGYVFPEYLRELYGNVLGIKLEKYNGDETYKLPIPSRFVIDQEGVIRHAYADPDYRFRAEPSETIFALQDLVVATTPH
jgi:peroxiredoxin